MNLRPRLLLLGILTSLPFCPLTGFASVIVVSNATSQEIQFWLGQPEQWHLLEPGELLSVPVTESVDVVVKTAAEPQRYQLRANRLYFFVQRASATELIEAGLFSDDAETATPVPQGTPQNALHEVPVMILVDDDEPMVPRAWERRLRTRLAAASTVFERDCRVRFKIVSIGTWKSDDTISQLDPLLRDFEQKVIPTPGRLAIGFTSQLAREPPEDHHLGGTRSPLGSHLLIREWGHGVSEVEKLELLMHELGHFLGASHSGEYETVMRPRFGDERSNLLSYRLGFDPLNTLIINLIAEELRSHDVCSLRGLQPRRKAVLRQVYQALAVTTPGDPTSGTYLELLSVDAPARPSTVEPAEPLVAATRTVIAAIAEAARENGRMATLGTGREPLTGDRLTELYVGRAAATARELPAELAAKAFLLGLGIGLDRSAFVRDAPVIGGFYGRVESTEERTARLSALGTPAMHRRYDLTQHFVVSAALTVWFGPFLAETAGTAKELQDARGGSGFSFADLAADMSGIAFASAVLDGRLPLAKLSESFRVSDFLPPVDGLEEGISWEEFRRTLGSAHSQQLLERKAAIAKQVLALPPYQAHGNHAVP